MTPATAIPALVTVVETVIVCVQRLLPMVMSVANTAWQSNGEHNSFVVSTTIKDNTVGKQS